MRADSTESSRPSDCVGTLIKTKDGTFVVMKAVFDPDQVPTFGTMAMVAHLRKQFPHRGRQAPMVAMITVPPGYDTSPRLERTEKKLKKKGIHIVGIPNSPCPVPSTEAMERFAARLALELEQAGDDAAAAASSAAVGRGGAISFELACSHSFQAEEVNAAAASSEVVVEVEPSSTRPMCACTSASGVSDCARMASRSAAVMTGSTDSWNARIFSMGSLRR